MTDTMTGRIHYLASGDTQPVHHGFRTFGPDDVLELSFEHGGPHIMSHVDPAYASTHKCAGCRHLTGMTWVASGDTHRVNRSGEPATITVGLCCHCWGELLRG